MIRIILYAGIVILVLFAIKFFRLLSSYKSGSRTGVEDIKERAANLKNKYKNIQEADFRDITSSDDENDSSKK